MTLRCCLSIAGFDGSGGAGLQADLKTFAATGCYGMTVLTALPVQNTQGVRACYALPLASIQQQLETLFDDCMPDAIKIGMLFSAEIIELVADFLQQHAQGVPIILDPVMVAKSGDPLLEPQAISALQQRLIPLSSLITPNLPEADRLVTPQTDPITQAKALLDLGCQAVLLKGGHTDTPEVTDWYLDAIECEALTATRIHSRNTHGTGCTLSAAITSYVAQGASLLEGCRRAKTYLHRAIAAAATQRLGKGHGPVHHFHQLWPHLI